MSRRRIGDIREESCRVYEGHFFSLSPLPCHRAPFVLQLFSVFVFFSVVACMCAHICACASLCVLVCVCAFCSKDLSVHGNHCVLQGTHGALHHPHRPGAGGGDAEESDGQGQQEGPAATFLPLTGPQRRCRAGHLYVYIASLYNASSHLVFSQTSKFTDRTHSKCKEFFEGKSTLFIFSPRMEMITL